ncbi:MAG: hypothetical protein JWR19_3106 [Pedosphaera sp.]|nr:hypothetical protein [Pedosphaera sp.]
MQRGRNGVDDEDDGKGKEHPHPKPSPIRWAREQIAVGCFVVRNRLMRVVVRMVRVRRGPSGLVIMGATRPVKVTLRSTKVVKVTLRCFFMGQTWSRFCHPLRGGGCIGSVSGGVAALNLRLLSGNPSDCAEVLASGCCRRFMSGPCGLPARDTADCQSALQPRCFRTGVMNNKVKQGILRIRPGSCRALRLDKVSQGGFKDGQGNLRQFKNQFFVSFRTGHHGEREHTYMRSLQNGGVAPPGLGKFARGSHGWRHGLLTSVVPPALGREVAGARAQRTTRLVKVKPSGN